MVEMVFPRVLALQVLEKTLRLERLLGLPRISQGAIDAEAVLAFRDQLKTIRRNLRLAARKLGPYGKELTPQVQQSVVRILNQCFNQIDYLHSLCPMSPANWIFLRHARSSVAYSADLEILNMSTLH